MVIDLRLLNDVAVDRAARTITFGGGCTWRDVDAAAAAHGLATTGGTVSHTGVGGLILGGGTGWLVGQHGMAIDCLLEAEVVLADGSVVNASDKENPDLFWALRGAGAAFGVATKFKSRLFPQGAVWAGMLIFPAPRLSEVVAAMNKWYEAVEKTGDARQAAMLILAYSPPPEPRAPVVMVAPFFDGPVEEAKSAFAPVLELGAMADMTGAMPYTKVNSLSDQVFEQGGRWQLGGTNFVMPLDAGMVQETFDIYTAGVDTASTDTDKEDMRSTGLVFEVMPNAKIREVALDATAFANRGPYFNAVIITSWWNAARDEEVRVFKRDTLKVIKARRYRADGEEGQGVGNYVNYGEEVGSARELFGANTERLRGLKQKWDPQNRYNKPEYRLV
jgi:hypothetical protein